MNRAAWLLLALGAVGTGFVLQQVFSASDEGPSLAPRDDAPATPAEPAAPTAPPLPALDEPDASSLGRDEAPAADDAPTLPDRLSGVVAMTDGTRVGKAKVRLEVVDLDSLLAGPRGVARFDLAVADANALPDDTAPIPGPILTTLETTTNEVGEFEFPALPCPAPQIFVERRERIIVEKEGFAPGVSWPFRRETTNVVLVRRDILRGTCRDDATDAPIRNAELIVTRSRADEGERHELTTHTDPDGRFVTEKPLSEGVYSFTILRDGHAPRTVTTAIRFDLFDLEFENHPTYVIRVEDESTGAPLSGARVLVEHEIADGHFGHRIHEMRSSVRGWGSSDFSFGDLAPGTLEMLERVATLGTTDLGGELRVRDLRPLTRLLVELDGFLPKELRSPSPLEHRADREVVEVELTKFGYLRGRVTDWAGMPMPGICVGRSAGEESDAVKTDGDGRFVYSVAATNSRRGAILVAFDPNGKHRSGTFPVAQVSKPGESVDLGTVALIRKDESEIEVQEPPQPRPDSTMIEAETSTRAPVVEVWRRRFKPGYDHRFIGDEYLLAPEFVGFAVADHAGTVEIELRKLYDQVVSVTAHDGAHRRVVSKRGPR